MGGAGGSGATRMFDRIRDSALLRGLLRRARRERGVVAVEFAMVAPVLIIVFIGMVEFTEAFTITRKLEQSAATVADLVAQEPSINTAQLSDIRLVASEIMKPYAPPSQLVIVSVVADATNTTKVAWSDPASAYAVGTPYVLPQDKLTAANTSIIVTEARYNFTPSISHFITGTFTFVERAYFQPRTGKAIAKAN
jgi:Flp pilus assembly protein TadG